MIIYYFTFILYPGTRRVYITYTHRLLHKYDEYDDRTWLALALVIEIVDLHTPAVVHARRRMARNVHHPAIFARVTGFANTPKTRNTS